MTPDAAKKTFYVVMDGMDKSYAAFPDLLPAIKYMDKLNMAGIDSPDSEYFKVEAVWAENPEDAARHGEDGYLRVFDTNQKEPAFFPEVDPAKKTFFMVEDWATELEDERLGIFTELLEALELWHFWADRIEDPATMKIFAFYENNASDIGTGDFYLDVWGANRYLPFTMPPVFDEYMKTKDRTVTRVKQGGWPKPKEWSPTGKFKLPPASSE